MPVGRNIPNCPVPGGSRTFRAVVELRQWVSNRRPCIGRRGPMSIASMPPLGNSMLACASGMPTVTTVAGFSPRLAAAGHALGLDAGPSCGG